MITQTTPAADTAQLKRDALQLLRQLIATPSFSGEEKQTAAHIAAFLESKGVAAQRKSNNVWARNRHYDETKPTLLLNSHHDTVKPNPAWTRDPFEAKVEDGKLYGLGSNDAGGCLAALTAAFLHFCEREDLPFNLLLAASAEEEISGPNGIESFLPELGRIDAAIVGEPTQMQLGIAEKGLLVLDCIAHGKAGHAARDTGVNAIYKAMRDIEWFITFQFPEVSPLLGPVRMSVTMIQAGTQHNVIPAECHFTVDVRVTEKYSNEEVLQVIRENTHSEVRARSLRLRSSLIPLDHPLVQAGIALGLPYFGSPTTSDKALISAPALKMGPGDSARSHGADEFLYVQELEEAIDLYIALLEQFFKNTRA